MVRVTNIAVALVALTVLVAVRPAGANETGGLARCVGGSSETAAAYNAAFGSPIGYRQGGDIPHRYRLPDGRVLWILNDSWINRTKPAGKLTPPTSTLVRNIAVVQTGLCFEVHAGVVPALPPAIEPVPESWYADGERTDMAWWWFNDGVVVGSELHIFASAMRQTGPVGFGVAWKPTATYILTLDTRSLAVRAMRPAPNVGATPGYGFSIAHDKDWTYLYGHNDNLQFYEASKDTYLARVPRNEVFAAPVYWSGSGWSAAAAAAVPVVSMGTWTHRMRVLHHDDRWIATAKEDDFFGDEFLILEAPLPQGPWKVTQRFPIATKTGGTDSVTYDGMAWPTSDPDRLIIAWSNNHFQWAAVSANPSIYRPSFAERWLGPPTQSNAVCNGRQPGASGMVSSGATSRYRAIEPRRLFDSRAGGGQRLPSGGTTTLDIATALGIAPAELSAAVVNITVTETAADGFATAYPAAMPRPWTSNLNVDRVGATAANLATVALDAHGRLAIFVSMPSHLIVDVSGVYQPVLSSAEGRFYALTPSRLLDTRQSGLRPPGDTITVVQVTGRGGVPAAGVTAVTLNVTATDVGAPGFVTAWGGGPRPLASNLNIAMADTRANQVIVPVAPDGSVRLYNISTTHLIVDVAGWYTDTTAPKATTGLFVGTTPIRLTDSRAAVGIPGSGCIASIAVPATASAAVVTVTATAGSRLGYLTAWPSGQPRPTASTLNIDRVGQTRANHATVALAGNTFTIFSEPRTQLIVDLTGWFT